MSKQQPVQFGDQPPKNPDVAFGKNPETAGPAVASSPGDDDPTIIGFVPVVAGGDDVPSTPENPQDEPDEPDPAPNPSEPNEPVTDDPTDG